MFFAPKENCTGCGACVAGCPVACIEMKVDGEGFRYPAVDSSRCISCRKCEAVCPVLKQQAPHPVLQAYGAKHKDETLRSASSSGGVFPALADFVLEKGGAVCGAAYGEDFSVAHQIMESAEEICRLQGAKYTQSRTEHLFPALRKMLENGRWVLFIGTPCQVAGFRAYLAKDFEKLILVDMICHGVPSPLAWEKYLGARVRKDGKGGAIVSVNQRDKASGWSNYRYSVRIDFEKGEVYSAPLGKDPYLLGFVNDLYLRPSCSQCYHKGDSRSSDLTLGDYWGVWDQQPQFDDDRGVSLVLIRTERGAACWNAIENGLQTVAVDAQAALTQNPSALHSTATHPKRAEFFDRMQTEDFDALVSVLLFGMTKKPNLLRRMVRKLLRR